MSILMAYMIGIGLGTLIRERFMDGLSNFIGNSAVSYGSGVANAGNDYASGAYQQALQGQLMAAYGQPAYNPPPTSDHFRELEKVKLKIEEEKQAQIKPCDHRWINIVQKGLHDFNTDTTYLRASRECTKCGKIQEPEIVSQNKQPEEKTMAVDTNSELLPDISLARVFKWAIVLIVAMGLGRRVWDLFGAKITDNLHKALDVTTGKPTA